MSLLLVVVGLLLGLLSSSWAQEPVCNVPGTCIGQVVIIIDATSDPEACLKSCKDVPDCEWFTSNPGLEICNLFADCTLNIDDCPDCISGEVTCPLLQCRMKGLCQGTLLFSESVPSHTKCQEDCAASVDCEYYSFNYDTYLCHHYADCPELNPASCPKCVSGQPGCGVDQFLMVMGGSSGSSTDDVELLSLNEDSTVPPCLLNFEQLPDVRARAAGGGLFNHGSPTFCGGRDINGDVNTEHYECFQYSYGFKIWTNPSNLPSESATSDTAWAYDEDWGLIMAGKTCGFNGSTTISSVVKTTDGVYFEALPGLPTGRRAGCLIVINSTHLFVAGGTGASAMTHIFDGDEWIEAGNLPGSKENRQNPGCGTAVNSEGQQEVVVAGGYDAEESASEYEVDIYNLVTGTWKTSENALPERLWSMASVPFQDSFLLVGGYGDGGYKDKIYQFDPQTEQFKLVIGARLHTARRDPVALMVDADSFQEC